eukprot:TRINITY_DN52389_c0_g1_i1.p1 TRINITY_DN52389_c0_g1~~TRINITY_DN52389_c0_g1_i1.p1  ORF type:complete len:307 (+),score=55.53 TRINITY_DN52389_c0_g1_i1:61-921(+)
MAALARGLLAALAFLSGRPAAGSGVKPIVLWAPPRSRSTAFERAIVEHPLTVTLHEQFADPHYFGPGGGREKGVSEKAMQALETSGLVRGKTYGAAIEEIVSAGTEDRPHVFTKELSLYWDAERIGKEHLANFTNSFLIREPEKVLRSFWRLSKRDPRMYFDAAEAGFRELQEIFEAVLALGQVPVVVDSEELLGNPEFVMRRWMKAVGLPFAPITSWRPASPENWKKYDGWHDDAASSSSFASQTHGDEDEELPAVVASAIAECKPIYDRLRAYRITADATTDEL